MADLSRFKGTLPYSSELFGVFQPLLGWRSARMKERHRWIHVSFVNRAFGSLFESATPHVKLNVDRRPEDVKTATVNLRSRGLPEAFNTLVGRAIVDFADRAKSERSRLPSDEEWRAFLTQQNLDQVLSDATGKLTEKVYSPDLLPVTVQQPGALQQIDRAGLLQGLLERESRFAGAIRYLGASTPSLINELLSADDKEVDLQRYVATADPLANFDPAVYRASLSPVGIIHLYRQYFFELESFLGSPVGHVWVAPGTTVELIEINRRKTLTERTVETATETTSRAETSLTSQDELSEAVHDENINNTKLGISASVTYSTPTVQANASASYNADTTRKDSRETTHKQMRQQSEKLSTEIKKNFKTTFRTVVETEDTSSKRYVLQNTSDKVINYELRRKMRQVGVQVQDIGVQLCWQTFVDNAGEDLGLAELVHIAKPADLSNIPPADQIPTPQPVEKSMPLELPFIGNSDKRDVMYQNGRYDYDETDDVTVLGVSVDHSEVHTHVQIQTDFPFDVVPPENYELSAVGLKSVEGDKTAVVTAIVSPASFKLHLQEVNFKGSDKIRIEVGLVFKPTPAYLDAVKVKNDAKERAYDFEKERAIKAAYADLVKERVKLASSIKPRPEWEMRDEERNVIYRKIIAELMRPKADFPRTGSAGEENQLYHITAEIVRAIFDVDKLLYFVAPDWWRPKSVSAGNLGAGSYSTIDSSGKTYNLILNQADDVITWGGIDGIRKNNYLITDDSAPARFGSSLGWILQLDGDNFRNAFLNSPWVKAVLPIRPSKENAALNWLNLAHVEGTDGLDDAYIAPAAEINGMIKVVKDAIEAGDESFQSSDSSQPNYVDPALLAPGKFTVHYALRTLAFQIKEHNQALSEPIKPNPADPADPVNEKAGSLPTEVVFEHGFDPLAGGVKYDAGAFQVFDQWTEILPTDQIVAMSVEYDAKTLRVK